MTNVKKYYVEPKEDMEVGNHSWFKHERYLVKELPNEYRIISEDGIARVKKTDDFTFTAHFEAKVILD